MNKKIVWQYRWSRVKEFLPNFKKTLASKKGSPTLEYVLIIAAGAAFAGLLLFVFRDKENSKAISDKFKTYINNVIDGSTKPATGDGNGQ